ncbi:MAG: cellulase family glycosylhydrolase [Defluviitaleaceae bacterium]|nr:cellulase family glycosylhydrolase [Defluviitaleaceae bacterium]
MKNKKIFVVTFFSFIFLFAHAAFADEISVSIDGAAVIFDGQGAAIIDGRTLVPVRGVFETLGFEVVWENATRTAVLKNDSHELRITIDREIFSANGENKILDVPAQLVHGRTMVPIRLPLEAVGFDVGWENSTRTVLISSRETKNETENKMENETQEIKNEIETQEIKNETQNKIAPTFAPTTAREMISKLGVGINLGNSLEARTWGELHEHYSPDWVLPNHMASQFAWGTPLIKQRDFAAISAMGFDHVRIPVTWEIHLDANGKILDEWFDRVQEVVDWALEAGFPVVINTHHERSEPTSLKVLIDKGDTAGAEAWLTNIWSQVAERFKNYPETLMFEPMNEPYRAFRGGWIWDWSTGRGVLDVELAKRINYFNHFALKIIRESGGFNDKRVVFLTAMGADPEAVPHYVHPDDEFTALGIFFYPGHDKHFQKISDAHAAGIPIYIKETAPIFDMDNERAVVPQEKLLEWIREHFGRFAKMGIPTAFWNCSGESVWELFNRSTGEWNLPLVNAVFAAYEKTPGEVLALERKFPHELQIFFENDQQLVWKNFHESGMFDSAKKIVVEHTGEIHGFSFVHISPPDWKWTQYDSWENDPRITRENGKIIFDLRGIESHQTYIFAVWEEDGWQDLISRAYLE